MLLLLGCARCILAICFLLPRVSEARNLICESNITADFLGLVSTGMVYFQADQSETFFHNSFDWQSTPACHSSAFCQVWWEEQTGGTAAVLVSVGEDLRH